jgi:hypothetical protein
MRCQADGNSRLGLISLNRKSHDRPQAVYSHTLSIKYVLHDKRTKCYYNTIISYVKKYAIQRAATNAFPRVHVHTDPIQVIKGSSS